MSPRTGRPKIDKPKTIEVKARIDEETNEKLMKYCKENQLSRTDVVRMGIEKVLECKQNVATLPTKTTFYQTEGIPS